MTYTDGLQQRRALFKGLCCGRVFLRVAWPRLLPRKAEALQEPSHRGRMEALTEADLADAHQILAREGREAAGLGIGASQNDAHQLGLLLRFKPRRPPIAPAIVKPLRAMRVVPDHPIPQALKQHVVR